MRAESEEKKVPDLWGGWDFTHASSQQEPGQELELTAAARSATG